MRVRDPAVYFEEPNVDMLPRPPYYLEAEGSIEEGRAVSDTVAAEGPPDRRFILFVEQQKSDRFYIGWR